MSKIYIKIFIGFWAINILTVLGHNVYVHWVNPSPESQLLAQYDNSPYDRFAVRGLNATIDAVMHYTLTGLRRSIPQVDDWIFRRVYIVDELNNDLRGREIPPIINEILGLVGPNNPYYITSEQGQSYAARYILLRDGNSLKIVSFSTPFYGRYVQWRLYLRSNWVLYLISLLVSGTACFFFARHMSHDFRALQQATKDIAKGDLSVRVAPQFASRHDEIAELSRDFDNMTARLEKSMQEQKRLIKDVSHELRSPLARLQFALGLAQQRSSAEAHAELEKARNAADYLNDIITTILSFPTHEAESWELNDVIEINSLLDTLQEDFADQAREKGVTLTYDSNTEDALVSTYHNTLIGVFENLFSNAVHYTLPNTRIDIRLRELDDRFRISVADQGPGVKEDQLTDIFEPFYRTDEARDRASGGYGLGLSIAQRTVQLHGGKISARNRAEGGLIVDVDLPKCAFDADEESESLPSAQTQTA